MKNIGGSTLWCDEIMIKKQEKIMEVGKKTKQKEGERTWR